MSGLLNGSDFPTIELPRGPVRAGAGHELIRSPATGVACGWSRDGAGTSSARGRWEDMVDARTAGAFRGIMVRGAGPDRMRGPVQ
jgi:hypothetical protein